MRGWQRSESRRRFERRRRHSRRRRQKVWRQGRSRTVMRSGGSWYRPASKADGGCLRLTTTFFETTRDSLAGVFPVNRFDGSVRDLARAACDLGGPYGFNVVVGRLVQTSDQVVDQLRPFGSWQRKSCGTQFVGTHDSQNTADRNAFKRKCCDRAVRLRVLVRRRRAVIVVAFLCGARGWRVAVEIAVRLGPRRIASPCTARWSALAALRRKRTTTSLRQDRKTPRGSARQIGARASE